jgi:hypothetical protein
VHTHTHTHTHINICIYINIYCSAYIGGRNYQSSRELTRGKGVAWDLMDQEDPEVMQVCSERGEGGRERERKGGREEGRVEEREGGGERKN